MWTVKLTDTIPHWDVVLMRDGAEVARIPLDAWQDLVAFTDFDAVNPRDRQPQPHPSQAAEPITGPHPG